MGKYDRKEIMKRAWVIFRKAGCTFSEALTFSWCIARKERKMKESDYEPNGTVKWSIWCNYGYIRAYYTRSWVSNYQNNKRTNYVQW